MVGGQAPSEGFRSLGFYESNLPNRLIFVVWPLAYDEFVIQRGSNLGSSC